MRRPARGARSRWCSRRWALTAWGGTQLALGVEVVTEGFRRWLGWLLVLCSMLGFAFAFTIALQGHLTAFSDGILFRTSTVGFTVWYAWTAWELARSDSLRPATTSPHCG